MIVEVIGLGFIGFTMSIVMANAGIYVIGYDENLGVVRAITDGSYLACNEMRRYFDSALESGLMVFTNKPLKANIYIVAVQTPALENGKAKMAYVTNAIESIIDLLSPGNILIVESTLPLGETERLRNLIFNRRPELRGEISIAYCPERISAGDSYQSVINNPRIVGECEGDVYEVKRFYELFMHGKIYCTTSARAEMSKLIENSSRYVQIAYANEISILCESVGLNAWEVISLANTHQSINILNPSIGVGGGCIPVDPLFLMHDYPENTRIIEASKHIDDKKKNWCIEVITKRVVLFCEKEYRRPVIAFMGLSYKPNVSDMRNSVALSIVDKIREKDICDLLVVEPNIKDCGIYKLIKIDEAYRIADIIVFLVAHKEFIFCGDIHHIIDFVGVTQR